MSLLPFQPIGYVPVIVKATAAPRVPPFPVVPGTQDPVTFKAQAMTASFAWGSEPGQAAITYVEGNSLQFGCQVTLQIGGHFMAGICKNCTLTQGSHAGTKLMMQFVDFREYLKWDYVFCSFNQPDVRMAGNTRVKRWKHLLPGNFDSWLWVYTNTPLPAYTILSYLFNAPTVGTPWNADLTGNGLFPAGMLGSPIYHLDFSDGTRLDAALNEICQRTGTVFTLKASELDFYHLEWNRKGFGSVPLAVSGMDDTKLGQSLSNNPTNVRVLGGRNLYQVMDVPLTRDWAPAWESFLVFERFADDIYRRLQYNLTPNDPEQFIGRQLASARALEITLQEYVDLRNAQSSGDGEPFRDTRLYSMRSRMQMPAALYMQTLVLRAFRPNITSFNNRQGRTVPLDSLNLADQLLARVSHDAATGAMDFDVNQPADGNGYAIVKGYQIAPELLRSIKSENWKADFFADANRSWAAMPFQSDDSGEGNQFLIFDAPLVTSENMLSTVDGHVMLNANFTLNVPSAKAALTFMAERFSWWQGTYPNVSRDYCEPAPGLFAEYILKNGQYTEVPFADGNYTAAKAQEIANALLLTQYWYYDGGRKISWDGSQPIASFGTQLSSMIDRVQISVDPEGGVYEIVDLTTERQRDSFEPERDLERKTIQNSLFAGQLELKHKAEMMRQTAGALRALPHRVMELFSKFLSGGVSPDGALHVTWFRGAGTGGGPPAGATLPAGSVIRQQPLKTTAGNTNTVADYAKVGTGTDQRTVFVGITVRHNEDANKPFMVQSTGSVPARVQGPVTANDVVGLSSDGSNNLVKDGTPPVGRALQDITDTSVKLIKIAIGTGGGGGGGDPVWLS